MLLTYPRIKNKPKYYYDCVEIFARTFEVAMSDILNESIFVRNLNYYAGWTIYPSLKDVKPIIKDVEKFIQLATQ